MHNMQPLKKYSLKILSANFLQRENIEEGHCWSTDSLSVIGAVYCWRFQKRKQKQNFADPAKRENEKISIHFAFNLNVDRLPTW